MLTLGLLGLFVVAIGLPLYWLHEPGRQDGRGQGLQRRRSSSGARRVRHRPPRAGSTAPSATAAEGRGRRGADYTITDADGRFVEAGELEGAGAQHRAAALQPRGGPLHPHLRPARSRRCRRGASRAVARSTTSSSRTSSTTSSRSSSRPKQAQASRCKRRSWPRCARMKDAPTVEATGHARTKTDGEALFNMGYDDGFAGGAYSCGRCHTTGLVLRREGRPTANGAFGPAARATVDHGAVPRCRRSVPSSRSTSSAPAPSRASCYGSNGQGTGRMPGLLHHPRGEGRSRRHGEVGVEARTRRHPGAGRHVHPGRGPGRSSTTSGACDRDEPPAARRASPGTRASGASSSSPSAVVVLMGSVFLLLATNTGARLGLPARPHRPLRLDDDHGHHLVDVRHRLQGAGARPGRCKERQRGNTQTGRARRSPAACPTPTTTARPPRASWPRTRRWPSSSPAERQAPPPR